MNMFNVIKSFIAVAAIVSGLAGCAGSNLHESTGEYFDDVILTAKVKSLILGDARVKFLQIHVESFKGIVQLSGFVDSQDAAERAVRLARTVRGVKQVNNSLIVK